MPTIKSIAFDLEGTVVDVEKAHHLGHIRAAEEFGVTLTLDDCFRLLPHFIGGPDDQVAWEIANLASESNRQVDYKDVLEAKKRHYRDVLTEIDIKPRPGFIDFFAFAQNLIYEDDGIKLFGHTIGSLTEREYAEILLYRSGILDLFGGYDNVVLREDVQNPKPAPDVWIETARRAGVNPDEQIIFEDSPRGVEGGVQIGAYCIGMPTYNRPDAVTSLVKAGVKRVFMSWDEINPEALFFNAYHEHEDKTLKISYIN